MVMKKEMGLKKKVEALTNVVQHMLNEIAHLKELAVGTLETIKQMPDYNEALENLKKQVLEKPGEEQEVDTTGKTLE